MNDIARSALHALYAMPAVPAYVEALTRDSEERYSLLLDRLRLEARDPAVNLMPVTIEPVEARAPLGEIVARLRRVFGSYVEQPVF